MEQNRVLLLAKQALLTFTVSLVLFGPISGLVLDGFSFRNELTRAGFFDAVTYIGAVKDATDTWYQGWTCNSSTATFGANGGACTAIPL